MYAVPIGYGSQHVRFNPWGLTGLRNSKRSVSELRGVDRSRRSLSVSFTSRIKRHWRPDRDPQSSTRCNIDKRSTYCPGVQQELGTLLPHFGFKHQSLATLMRLCIKGQAPGQIIIDIDRPRNASHVLPVGRVLAWMTEEMSSWGKMFKNGHLTQFRDIGKLAPTR